MPNKKKKVIRPFLRNQPLSEKLTTDRWTMDDEQLGIRKLRCLSAGGAKKSLARLS